MRPSLRQLEYAVALADAGHFGRAARACHVTQPALSTQIQRLEEELGLRLFERSRRGATLTPSGRWVVARARAVLEGVDELVEVAGGAGAPLCGPLHLGVIPTLAPYLLPQWLPRVREAYPELQLYLHEDRTARLVEALVGGRLDLLLLALPLDAPGLETLPIFHEVFLLAVPRGHRLARTRGGVMQSELEGEPVLLLEDGHCLRDQALDVCRMAGARESDQIRAASLTTLAQMVAGGLGVTLLPESAVAIEAASSEVVVRRFRAPAPTREIGLAWRRTSPRDDEFHLLGDLLRATL